MQKYYAVICVCFVNAHATTLDHIVLVPLLQKLLHAVAGALPCDEGCKHGHARGEFDCDVVYYVTGLYTCA